MISKIEGGIRSKFIIERISKTTRNVVEKREFSNVLTRRGALHIRQAAYEIDPTYITGDGSALRPDKLVLMGSGRIFIKEIPNGSRSYTDSLQLIFHNLEWIDDSPDEYTIAYAGIGQASTSYSGTVNPNTQLIHIVDVSPTFTKYSNETIRYTWAVGIPYEYFNV